MWKEQLKIAIAKGDLRKTTQLFHTKQASSSMLNSGTGQPLLFVSIEFAQHQMLEYFLKIDQASIPMIKDLQGNSCLMFSIQSQNCIATEIILDKHPELIDHKNNLEQTPLMFACQYGAVEVAEVFSIDKRLLIMGVKVNDLDSEGSAALHYATAWGHQSITRLLLEKGADPKAKNLKGWSPIDYSYNFKGLEYVESNFY